MGTPGFLDPLALNEGQHTAHSDGFALAITALMCLVGQPAVGLVKKCRSLLRYPSEPERW